MQVHLTKSLRVGIVGKFQTYQFESGASSDFEIKPLENVQDDADLISVKSTQDRIALAEDELFKICIDSIRSDIDQLSSQSEDFRIVMASRGDELTRHKRYLVNQGLLSE